MRALALLQAPGGAMAVRHIVQAAERESTKARMSAVNQADLAWPLLQARGEALLTPWAPGS